MTIASASAFNVFLWGHFYSFSTSVPSHFSDHMYTTVPQYLLSIFVPYLML